MLDINNLKAGDKVCYEPEHYMRNNKYENGVIKAVPDFALDPDHALYNHVFVVYNCNDDWDNYESYTAALTNIRDLSLGWG